MLPDIDALSLEYTQALFVVAKAARDGKGYDHDLVDIPHAIISVIRSIFPNVGDVTLFWNKKINQWDVAHRDQETSHTSADAAVARATTIIRDLFEDLRLAAGSRGENPPGAGEGNPPTPDDLPPGVAARYRLDHHLFLPRRVTCPHCGEAYLEK
jgi:hypothetical protein